MLYPHRVLNLISKHYFELSQTFKVNVKGTIKLHFDDLTEEDGLFNYGRYINSR